MAEKHLIEMEILRAQLGKAQAPIPPLPATIATPAAAKTLGKITPKLLFIINQHPRVSAEQIKAIINGSFYPLDLSKLRPGYTQFNTMAEEVSLANGSLSLKKATGAYKDYGDNEKI